MPTKAELEQELFLLKGHLRQQDDTISELRLASSEKDAKIENKSLRVEELEVELERTKKSLRRSLAEGIIHKKTINDRQGEVDTARSVKGDCDHASHLADRIVEHLARAKGGNLDTDLLTNLAEVLKGRLGQVEESIGPFSKFPDTEDDDNEKGQVQAASSCKAADDGLSLKRQRKGSSDDQLQLTDGHDAAGASSSSKRQKTATASSSKRELRRHKPRKQTDGEAYQEARQLVCDRLRVDLGTTVGRTVLAEILKLGVTTQNTLIENYNSAYEGASKNDSPDAATGDDGADDDFRKCRGFSSWTEWRHSISEARKRNLQFRNSYRERTQGIEEKLNDLNEWLDSSVLPAYPSLRTQNRDALRRIVCQWPTLSLSERRIVENAKTPWHDIRKARLKFRAADLAAQRAAGTLLTGPNAAPVRDAEEIKADRPDCDCDLFAAPSSSKQIVAFKDPGGRRLQFKNTAKADFRKSRLKGTREDTSDSREGPPRKKVRFGSPGEPVVPREDPSEVDPWFSEEAKAEAARVQKKWDKILQGDKHRRSKVPAAKSGGKVAVSSSAVSTEVTAASTGSKQKTDGKESVFAVTQLPVVSTVPAPSGSASAALRPVPTAPAALTHVSGRTVVQVSSWGCLQSGSLIVTQASACDAAHPLIQTSARNTPRPSPPVTGCAAALAHVSERTVVQSSSWGCLQFGSLTVTQASACDTAHSLIQTSARNTPGPPPLVAGCTTKAPAHAPSGVHTTAGQVGAKKATRFFAAPRSSGSTEQAEIEERFITEIVYDPAGLKEGKFIRVGERRRTVREVFGSRERVAAAAAFAYDEYVSAAIREEEKLQAGRASEDRRACPPKASGVPAPVQHGHVGPPALPRIRRGPADQVQVEDRFITEAVYDPAGLEEGKFIRIGERRRTIREIFGSRGKVAAVARATCDDEASAVRAGAVAKANYDEDVAEAIREEEALQARRAASNRRACPPRTSSTPATAPAPAEEEEDLWPGYSDPEVLELVAESKARGYAHLHHDDYHAYGVSDHISRAQWLVYKARSKARSGGKNTLVPVSAPRVVLKAAPKVVLKAAAKPSPTSRNPAKAVGEYHKLNQPYGSLDSESPVPTGIFAREPTKEEEKLFEQKAEAARELKRKVRAIRGFITDTVEAAAPEPVPSSEAVAEVPATATEHVDAGAASSAPAVAGPAVPSSTTAAEPPEETLEDLSRELDDAIQGFEKLIQEDEAGTPPLRSTTPTPSGRASLRSVPGNVRGVAKRSVSARENLKDKRSRSKDISVLKIQGVLYQKISYAGSSWAIERIGNPVTEDCSGVVKLSREQHNTLKRAGQIEELNIDGLPLNVQNQVKRGDVLVTTESAVATKTVGALLAYTIEFQDAVEKIGRGRFGDANAGSVQDDPPATGPHRPGDFAGSGVGAAGEVTGLSGNVGVAEQAAGAFAPLGPFGNPNQPEPSLSGPSFVPGPGCFTSVEGNVSSASSSSFELLGTPSVESLAFEGAGTPADQSTHTRLRVSSLGGIPGLSGFGQGESQDARVALSPPRSCQRVDEVYAPVPVIRPNVRVEGSSSNNPNMPDFFDPTLSPVPGAQVVGTVPLNVPIGAAAPPVMYNIGTPFSSAPYAAGSETSISPMVPSAPLDVGGDLDESMHSAQDSSGPGAYRSATGGQPLGLANQRVRQLELELVEARRQTAIAQQQVQVSRLFHDEERTRVEAESAQQRGHDRASFEASLRNEVTSVNARAEERVRAAEDARASALADAEYNLSRLTAREKEFQAQQASDAEQHRCEVLEGQRASAEAAATASEKLARDFALQNNKIIEGQEASSKAYAERSQELIAEKTRTAALLEEQQAQASRISDLAGQLRSLETQSDQRDSALVNEQNDQLAKLSSTVAQLQQQATEQQAASEAVMSQMRRERDEAVLSATAASGQRESALADDHSDQLVRLSATIARLQQQAREQQVASETALSQLRQERDEAVVASKASGSVSNGYKVEVGKLKAQIAAAIPMIGQISASSCGIGGTVLASSGGETDVGRDEHEFNQPYRSSVAGASRGGGGAGSLNTERYAREAASSPDGHHGGSSHQEFSLPARETTPGFGAERLNQTTWPRGLTPPSLFTKLLDAQQSAVATLVNDSGRQMSKLLESKAATDRLLVETLEELKAARDKPAAESTEKAKEAATEAVQLLWKEHRGGTLNSEERRTRDRRVGQVLGHDDDGYAAPAGGSDAGSSILGSMLNPTKFMFDGFMERYYAANREAVQDNATQATAQRAQRLYSASESIGRLQRFLCGASDRGDLGNDINAFAYGGDPSDAVTREGVRGFSADGAGFGHDPEVATGLYMLGCGETVASGTGLSTEAMPQYEYCRRQGFDTETTAWHRRECVDDDLPVNFTPKASLEYRLLKAVIHSATVLDSGSGLAPGVANVAPTVPTVSWTRESVIGHYQSYFRELEARLTYYGLRGWQPFVLDIVKCVGEESTEAMSLVKEHGTYGEHENLVAFAIFELGLASKCQVDFASLVAEIMEERYVPLDIRHASARTRGGEWASRQEKTVKKLLDLGLDKKIVWPRYNTRTFNASVLSDGVYDQAWMERYVNEVVKSRLAADGKAVPSTKVLVAEQRKVLKETALESIVRYCSVNAASGVVFGAKTYLRMRDQNRRNYRSTLADEGEYADPVSYLAIEDDATAGNDDPLCLDVETCRAVSAQDDAEAWAEEQDRSFIAIRDAAKGKALLGKGEGRSKSAGKSKASGEGSFPGGKGKRVSDHTTSQGKGKGKHSGTSSKGKSASTSAGPAESPDAVCAASAANRSGAFPMVVRCSEICGNLHHGTSAHTASDIVIATMAAAGEGSFDTQDCALCGFRHLGYLVLLAGQEVFLCPTYLRSKRKGDDMPSGLKCTRRSKPSEPSILVPKVFSIIRSGEKAMEEWLSLERNLDCRKYLSECSLLEFVISKARAAYKTASNTSSATVVATSAKAMHSLTSGLPYDMWDTTDPGSDYLHLIDAIHSGAFDAHYKALAEGSNSDAVGDNLMQQGVASHLSGISLSDASVPLNLQSLLHLAAGSPTDVVQQLCRALSGASLAPAPVPASPPAAVTITDVTPQSPEQDPTAAVLRSVGSPTGSPVASPAVAAAAMTAMAAPGAGDAGEGQGRMMLVNYTTDPGLHIAGGTMKMFSSEPTYDSAATAPTGFTEENHTSDNGTMSSRDGFAEGSVGTPLEEGQFSWDNRSKEEGAVFVNQTDEDEHRRLTEVGTHGVTRSEPSTRVRVRMGSILARVALHVFLLALLCHLGTPTTAVFYGSCSLGFETTKIIQAKTSMRTAEPRASRTLLPLNSRTLRRRDAAGLLGKQNRYLYSNWSWGSLNPHDLFHVSGDTLAENIDLWGQRWDACIERFVADCSRSSRSDKRILALLVDHDFRFWDRVGGSRNCWNSSTPRVIASALRDLETVEGDVSIVFALQEDICYGVKYLGKPGFEARVRAELLKLECPRVAASFFVMNTDLEGLGRSRVPLSWNCAGAVAAQKYFESYPPGAARVSRSLHLNAGVGLLRGLGLAPKFCSSGRLRIPIRAAHQMLLNNSGAYYATPTGTREGGVSGVLVTGRRHVTLRDLVDRKHVLVEGVGGFTAQELFELYTGSGHTEKRPPALEFKDPDSLWAVVADAEDLTIDDTPLSDDDAADAFYLEAERQAHYAHPDTQRQMQETAASLHGRVQRGFPDHPRSCWSCFSTGARRRATTALRNPRELVRLLLCGVVRSCFWVAALIGAPLNVEIARDLQLPMMYGILHSPDPTDAFLNRVGPGGVGQLAFDVNGSNFQTQPEPLGNRVWGGLYDKKKNALLVTLLLLDTGCLVSRYVSGSSLVSCQYLAANDLPYYAYDGFSEVVYFGSPECGRQAEPCRWSPLDLRFSGWTSDLKKHHPIGPQQGFCFAEARNPGSSRRLKAVRDNDQFFNMSQRGEAVSQYGGDNAGDMLCSWSWALAVTWLFCFDSIILGHQDLSRLGLSLCPAGTPGDQLGAYLLSQVALVSNRKLVTSAYVLRAPLRLRNANFWILAKERLFGKEASAGKSDKELKEKCASLALQPKSMTHHMAIARELVASGVPVAVDPGSSIGAPAVPTPIGSGPAAGDSLPEVKPTLKQVQDAVTSEPEMRHFWCSHRAAESIADGFEDLTSGDGLPSLHQLQEGIRGEVLARGDSSISAGLLHGVLQSSEREEDELLDNLHEDGASEAFRLLEPEEDLYESSDEEDEDCPLGIAAQRRAYLSAGEQDGFDDSISYTAEQRVAARAWAADSADADRRLADLEGRGIRRAPGWRLVVLLYVFLGGVLEDFVKVVHGASPGTDVFGIGSTIDPLQSEEIYRAVQVVVETDVQSSTGGVSLDAAKGFLQLLLSSRLCRYTGWVYKTCVRRPRRMFLGLAWAPGTFCALVQTCFSTLRDPNITWRDVCGILRAWCGRGTDELIEKFEAAAGPSIDLHASMGTTLEHEDGAVYVVGSPSVLPETDENDIIPGLDDSDSDSGAEYCASPLRKEGSGAYAFNSASLDFGDSESDPDDSTSSPGIDADGNLERTCPFEARFSDQGHQQPPQQRFTSSTGSGETPRKERRRSAGERLRALLLAVPGVSFLVPYVDDLNYGFKGLWSCLFRTGYTMARSLQVGMKFSLKKIRVGRALEILGWKLDFVRECRLPDPDKAGAIRAFKWSRVTKSVKILKKFLCQTTYIQEAYLERDEDYLKQYLDKVRLKKMGSDPKAKEAFIRLRIGLCRHVELGSIDVESARGWRNFCSKENPILRILVDSSQRRVSVWGIQYQKGFGHRVVFAYTRKFSKEERSKHSTSSVRMETAGLLFLVRVVLRRIPKIPFVLYSDNTTLTQEQLWSLMSSITTVKSLVSMASEILACLQCREVYVSNLKGHSMVLPDAATRVDGDEGEDLFTVDRLRDLLTKLPNERYIVDLVFPSTETICVVPCGLVASKIDLLKGIDFKVTNWASREVSVTPQLFVTEMGSSKRIDLRGDLLIAPSGTDAASFAAVEDSAILQGADEAAVDAAIAKRLKRAEYKITPDQFSRECAERLFDVLKDWPLALQCCLTKVFMVFRVVLWTEGLPFPTVMVASAYHPIKPDAKTGGYRRISLEDLLDKILRFHLAEQVYESLLGKYLPIYGLPLHLSALFLAVRKADCLGRLIVDAVQCNKLFPPCSYPLASCEMVHGNLLTTHVAMTLGDYIAKYGRGAELTPSVEVGGALQAYIPAEKNAVGNLKEFLVKGDATFRLYRFTDLPDSGKRGDSVLMKASPAGLLPQNGGRFLDMKPTAARRPRIRAVELLHRMHEGWFKHPPSPCEFRVYKVIEGLTDQAFDAAASQPGGVERVARKVRNEKEAKKVFLGTPSVPFLCANCVAVDTNADYVIYSCGSLADPAAVVCPPVAVPAEAENKKTSKKRKAKGPQNKRNKKDTKNVGLPDGGNSDSPRNAADPSAGSSTDPPRQPPTDVLGEDVLPLDEPNKDFEEAADEAGDAPGLELGTDGPGLLLPAPHGAPDVIVDRDREEITIPGVGGGAPQNRIRTGVKKGKKKATLLPLPDPIGDGLGDGVPVAGESLEPGAAADEDFRVKPDTLVKLRTQQLKDRAGFTKRARQLVEYFSASEQVCSVALDPMCLIDDDLGAQPVESGKYLYNLCLNLLRMHFGADLQFAPSGILVVSSLHKTDAELWGLPKFATRICCLGTDPTEGYRFGFTQDFTTVADGLWVLPERVYVVYSREMSSLINIDADFLRALRTGQHRELRYVFAAHDARSQGLSEAAVQKRVEEALSVRKKPTAAKVREKTADSKRFVIQGGLVFVFRSVSRGFYVWLPKDVQKEVKLEGVVYRNTTPLRVLCSFAHTTRGHAGPTATYEIVLSLGFFHDGLHSETELVYKLCLECSSVTAGLSPPGISRSEGYEALPSVALFVDFMTNLPRTKRGNTVIFTANDGVSGFPYYYAGKHATAEFAASCVVDIYTKYIEWYLLQRSDNGSHFLKLFREYLEQRLTKLNPNKVLPQHKYSPKYSARSNAPVEAPHKIANRGIRLELFGEAGFERVVSSEGPNSDMMLTEESFVTDAPDDALWDEKLDGVISRMVEQPLSGLGGLSIAHLHRGRSSANANRGPRYTSGLLTDATGKEVSSLLRRVQDHGLALKRHRAEEAAIRARKRYEALHGSDLGWLTPGEVVMRVKVCPRKFETKLVRQLYVLRRVYQNSADLERLDGRRYFGGNPLNVVLMRPISLCYSAVVAIAAGRLITIGSHNIDGLRAGFKRGWKLQIAGEILQQTACFGQETKIQPHHEGEWRDILHCMSGTTVSTAHIDFRSCTTRAGNYGSFAMLRSGVTLPDTPSLEDDKDYNPGLEGRIIVADLGGGVAAVSLYNVNSGKALSRLGTRLQWDKAVADLMINLKGRLDYVFVIGDFNALWDHSASSRGSEVTYLDEEGERIPSLTVEESASLHGMVTSSKYTKIAVTHSSDGCPYNFRCGRGHTGDFSLSHLFAASGRGKTITPPIGNPSLQNFTVEKIPSTETDAFVMGHLAILASQYDHCGLIFQAVSQ
eukprot:g13825.t1